MLGNGINVLIVATGSRPGEPPIVGADGTITDPVPQALVLTAIVIGFAIVAFMLALVWRNWTLTGDDQVEDDVEDRRLAQKSATGSNKSVAMHHEDVA
jgi:multicomponent Na+:H+ antiporter subunit C